MDKRVEKTKEKLHTALIELMEKQPLYSIAVSRLCKKAGINRNTFYSHYENTADILEEIITYYEKMAIKTIQETAPGRDFEQMLKEICLMMYNDKNLRVLMTLDDFGARYLARATKKCNEQIVEIFRQSPLSQ